MMGNCSFGKGLRGCLDLGLVRLLMRNNGFEEMGFV